MCPLLCGLHALRLRLELFAGDRDRFSYNGHVWFFLAFPADCASLYRKFSCTFLLQRTWLLGLAFATPFWLHAGLGQGTLDYSKRNMRVQGKMYNGTMFKGAEVQSYKNLRYDMAGSNRSYSRFNVVFLTGHKISVSQRISVRKNNPYGLG